jgi:hypothetical protein
MEALNRAAGVVKPTAVEVPGGLERAAREADEARTGADGLCPDL